MKIISFLLSLILSIAGCKLMPKESEPKFIAIEKDDSAAVWMKLFKSMHLVAGHDSDEYRSRAVNLLLTIIYTQKDTTLFLKHLINDTVSSFAGYRSVEKLKTSDSTVIMFYQDILKLRKEFPALDSGRYLLLDKNNPFISGFERVLKKDTLLIIANMDNNVQAFSANFPYSELNILVSNYDIGPMPPLSSSLTLRPFEIKVYKLGEK